MDKHQLDGNGNGRILYEDENENENIIKLRRTKNRNNKNSHIITIMDTNDDNHTIEKQSNLSKWMECFKMCFCFVPDITSENIKNVTWKIIIYLIMLYFLRKIIIEVKCF
jgi:hypothetical protein